MPVNGNTLFRARVSDALIYWVYIPGAVIGSGYVVDRFASLSRFPRSTWVSTLGIILTVVGIGLIQKSTRDLAFYGGGTPNPMAPPRRLVREGSYALCRHPMFLGYDLAALGIVVLLRSPGMLLLSYPVFLFFQRRFLQKEESRVLLKRFGGEFEEYRRKVPFLLPGAKRRGA